MNKVDLLAPAGEMSALIAAVQNGADAVYVGGRGFGARANASNFDGQGLVDAVEYCHARGVKLDMTVNTLVRDDEMEQVYDLVRDAVQAGIDAAIVQDLGVAQMLHAHFPGLHLHASTQMTVMNLPGALRAREMGMTRVVPARECTLADIRAIAQSGLEVEVFVHGALCVGYSGQCLLSSMIGGRSGNRGRCAQPCRLPYAMDGKKKHFLSPADLCALDDLGAITSAGATSLKIEGRLKRPEYVAVVTAAYRRALDGVLTGKPVDTAPDRDELLAIFNRGGFTCGYTVGKNDAAVMANARPNHWGIRVGTVLSSKNGRAKVRLTAPLHKGDGLEARGASGDRGILVQNPDGDLRVPEGVRPGDVLYRTTDAEQLRRAQESWAQEHRQTPVDAHFTACVGQPCSLELGGQKVFGETVQQAQGKPLTEESVRRQLSKLGDTVLTLRSLTCDLDDSAFLPVSALNALRRSAAEQCTAALLASRTPDQTTLPYQKPNHSSFRAENTLFLLQSDDVGELLSAQHDADGLYYEPRDLTEAALTAALSRLPERVAVVLPTALSGDELEEALRAIGSRTVVCNNIAQIRPGCVADAGLNAFNGGTLRVLTGMGAQRVTLSPECTLSEAEKLAQSGPAELIVRGNVPLMTLRHCPIRAEKGLDERGRERCDLCGRRGTTLTDRKGETLVLTPYRAASGCRMQVRQGRAYSALAELPRIMRAGFAAVRVIGTHQELLRVKGAAEGRGTTSEKESTTFGHLYKGVE